MREGRPTNLRDGLLRRDRSMSPIVRFRSPRGMENSHPKPVLNTLTLLGVIYTASISGGYGLEDSVSAGGPLLSIIFLCLIPFIWGIPVSLCVAELSCAIPSNAGPIMWVNCSFSSWVTFTTVLWTAFLNTVDNSLYPVVFADYCATLLHLGLWEKTLLKICFVALCGVINVFGVMLVGTFSVCIMFITVLPFVLMFVMQLPQGLNWERITYVPDQVNWAIFLPVVAWNFSGFDSAGNVIEEVENPNLTFIRALLLMIAAALATYIPPILTGASAPTLENVPFDHWGDGFWVKVGEAVGGTPLACVVMVGGAISTLGLMTTLLTTTSRSLAGMGTLNTFPSVFSKWVSTYSEKFNSPVNAILVNMTVTCVLSICLSFRSLVQLDQVLYSLRLITILAAFLKLRLNVPFLERPYRAPGGNFAAFIWAGLPIAFSSFIIATSMTGGPLVLYSSLALILGTMFVSFIAVRYFRPDGFEGSLVEEYEDADMQTYGALLENDSIEWRKFHPSGVFIENPPIINYARFEAKK